MAEDFREQQLAFAAHLRDPDATPAPEGIEDRRMAIYRRLFINNMQSLLAGTFPVLHAILGAARWSTLVRAFYAEHVSRSPLFLEVPREFLDWLANEFEGDASWPGFLYELAHYEWVELDVSVDPQEIDEEKADPNGNILEGVPVISPVARPLAYRWPVHRIGPAFQPAEAPEQPTFLLVHRRRNDDVRFTEINGITARLLELLQSNDTESGRELLERLASELGHENSAIVIESGARILEDLQTQEVILGTR